VVHVGAADIELGVVADIEMVVTGQNAGVEIRGTIEEDGLGSIGPCGRVGRKRHPLRVADGLPPGGQVVDGCVFEVFGELHRRSRFDAGIVGVPRCDSEFDPIGGVALSAFACGRHHRSDKDHHKKSQDGLAAGIRDGSRLHSTPLRLLQACGGSVQPKIPPGELPIRAGGHTSSSPGRQPGAGGGRRPARWISLLELLPHLMLSLLDNAKGVGCALVAHPKGRAYINSLLHQDFVNCRRVL